MPGDHPGECRAKRSSDDSSAVELVTPGCPAEGSPSSPPTNALELSSSLRALDVDGSHTWIFLPQGGVFAVAQLKLARSTCTGSRRPTGLHDDPLPAREAPASQRPGSAAARVSYGIVNGLGLASNPGPSSSPHGPRNSRGPGI
jgi:hypothetical protein